LSTAPSGGGEQHYLEGTINKKKKQKNNNFVPCSIIWCQSSQPLGSTLAGDNRTVCGRAHKSSCRSSPGGATLLVCHQLQTHKPNYSVEPPKALADDPRDPEGSGCCVCSGWGGGGGGGCRGGGGGCGWSLGGDGGGGGGCGVGWGWGGVGLLVGLGGFFGGLGGVGGGGGGGGLFTCGAEKGRRGR